jgi:hypothetical protein
VVGVIVNLAAFFAWHVLWPRGCHGRHRSRRPGDIRRRNLRAVPREGRRHPGHRRVRPAGLVLRYL